MRAVRPRQLPKPSATVLLGTASTVVGGSLITMWHRMRWVWLFLITVLVTCAFAQETPTGVPAGEAWRDIGKTESVCGQVVDSSWLSSKPNAPTNLYLDRPRPEQVFTVVIPFVKRDVFGESPEKSFRGKRICATGKIEVDSAEGVADRKHRAQLVVEDEEQITVG